MRKRFFSRLLMALLLIYLPGKQSWAQMYVKGPVYIKNAETVYSTGDIIVGSGGSISNAGTIDIKGNFTANVPVTLGGTLKFTASGAFNGSSMTTITDIVATTSGTVTTNNRLTLADGASMLHGSGTTGGGGAVSGAITVLRIGDGSSQIYNYWSTPVIGAGTGVLGNPTYQYNPDIAAHVSVESDERLGWENASGVLTAGRGYASAGAGTASFNGVPYNGNINFQIRKNQGTPANDVGWNLVGNPYPSSISASAFLSSNSSVIQGAIYLWDDDGSGGAGWTSGDYATSNGAGVVGGGNGTSFSGHIASGQGFMVEKTANGTANVTFTNSMRGTQNDDFFREAADFPRMWLSLTNVNGQYNETLLAFLSDATEGVDWAYDALKIRGNPDIALYSRIGDDPQSIYAIQGLPPVTSDRTVALGLDAGVEGMHTLHLRAIENFDPQTEIYLEDRVLNVFQDLRENDTYDFHTVAEDNIHRFFLHFSPVSVTTGIDTNDPELFTVFGTGGGITVQLSKPLEGDLRLKIHNSLGQMVWQEVWLDGRQSVHHLDLPAISSGTYFITIHSGASEHTELIFLGLQK